jgi:hypothetical protein
MSKLSTAEVDLDLPDQAVLIHPSPPPDEIGTASHPRPMESYSPETLSAILDP